MLNEESLIQMGVEEKAHQLSLLYAIKELFSGDSPKVGTTTLWLWLDSIWAGNN